MSNQKKAEAKMSVRVTRRFDFPAEQVFDAWLDPDKVGKFLFKTPDGVMTQVEINACVGGKFFIAEKREESEVEHVGEYLEIDRPHRLVFTFGVPRYSEEMTVVTIDITSEGDGCELNLLHEGVLPEWTERTLEGWGKILQTLNSIL
ncbi:Uncharacterized conserved protein YndB, AHSA1/START domain [Nitrosomonas sp. Nm51]|uniref:SRPBCC family protein n=1 Tax=Nitrosomonas sp. Nm51 TaxID=133720 RepID=UPI0008B90ED7|nr:SRPBCC domain-containing protein [Nitrosomonas sp. Nm51]SER80789.1 Uncharacterized conserved protein YndB, AHSA1/START domain [Nitrosomonas sp. Nm51]